MPNRSMEIHLSPEMLDRDSTDDTWLDREPVDEALATAPLMDVALRSAAIMMACRMIGLMSSRDRHVWMMVGIAAVAVLVCFLPMKEEGYSPTSLRSRFPADASDTHDARSGWEESVFDTRSAIPDIEFLSDKCLSSSWYEDVALSRTVRISHSEELFWRRKDRSGAVQGRGAAVRPMDS